MKKPIAPFRNGGRDGRGRFAAGNPGGPGNPYVKRTAEIRAAMMETVSENDLRAIVRALVKKAKRGDTVAAREVLDRLIGKPLASVTVEAIPPPGPLLTPEEAFAEIEAEYHERHPEARATG